MSTERFRRLVNDFGWFHQGIGVLGGLLFFIGSILFLWKDPLQLIGIYLFIVGSFGMLVGNIGSFLIQLKK
ncbi:MAG: YrhK family protein [Nitrococcus sp.]|nr:YrhK family protein [Nitrococcus sp.]